MATAREIKEQFELELRLIRDAANYLLDEVSLDYDDAQTIIRTLKRYQYTFENWGTLQFRDFIADNKTHEALLAVLNLYKKDIQEEIIELKAGLQWNTNIFILTCSDEKQKEFHDIFTTFWSNSAEANQTTLTRESVAKTLRSITGYKYSEQVDFEEIVEFVFEESKRRMKENKLRDLQYLLRKRFRIENAMIFRNTTTTISVLRHSFILLMAVFDAALFDLVKHFSLHLKEKVKLSAAIEELKQRQIIYRDPESDKKFEQLMEHVLRRNVHLHERGYVHEKYTEGVAKLPSINPKLVKGDHAVIDQEYFHCVIDRCNECINQIYSFITSEQT